MIRKFRITGYEPAVEKIASILDGIHLGHITVLSPQTRVVKIAWDFVRPQDRSAADYIKTAFDHLGWTDVVVSEIFE